MSKINCIIIEDEPLATKVLVDYVAQIPFLELQETFRDAILAMDWLRDNKTDLIFLDIHLPKLKGMAFLKTLSHPPQVIITTAYHQYAVEGFDLNVTDYLLKPIEFERFLLAVNKINKSKPDTDQGISNKGFIFINVQKKKVKILFEEILYIESQREYIKLMTTKGEFVTKMTTQEIESLLPPAQFRRIHRSFIVNINKIDAFTADSVEINRTSLPIGRGYRDSLDKM